MLKASLLFTCAALGCAVTFQTDARAEDRDKEANLTQQPADIIRTRPVHRPVFVDWKYKMVHASNGTDRYPANPNTDNHASLLQEFRYDSVNTYVPMPIPGGGHGIGYTGDRSWVAHASTKKVAESGAPIVFLIRERNCPFPFNTNGRQTDPDALRHALDAVPRLDYLFLDLEMNDAMVERNLPEIVRMVREHPNPQVSNAFIGNYHEYAGDYSAGYPWANLRDRTAVGPQEWDRAALYASSGLNVAMPQAYPWENLSVHTNPNAQRDAGTTPNDRAAMLWAPVVHVSAASRALPEGHKLVPWVSTYIPHDDPTEYEMYHARPSPKVDSAAIIQHLRLRGANGYAYFSPNTINTGGHPEFNYKSYRKYALDAWAALDPAFEGADTIDILTLSDEKSSGVLWSGVRNGDRVTILVSNLSGSGESVSINLPEIDGLPSSTGPVADGTHRVFVYNLSDSVGSQSTNDDAGSSDGDDDSSQTIVATNDDDDDSDQSGTASDDDDQDNTGAYVSNSQQRLRNRVYRSRRGPGRNGND